MSHLSGTLGTSIQSPPLSQGIPGESEPIAPLKVPVLSALPCLLSPHLVQSSKTLPPWAGMDTQLHRKLLTVPGGLGNRVSRFPKSDLLSPSPSFLNPDIRGTLKPPGSSSLPTEVSTRKLGYLNVDSKTARIPSTQEARAGGSCVQGHHRSFSVQPNTGPGEIS